ncbi:MULTISPECIES: hypothetical protein [unclassified Neorhizobium]|uniref:hypothetical protein n=1 Tax=unclassified Neorhizobium TaxID=2629175 RepID=UPI001FF6525C|nr:MULTISPECIES: hypothetical protein [unclassified Neorhizobium]MCJ9672915.1 hypothetical protein [Neorhizobium sp. SHOUNA12B]MCJ9748544.1 hypothetical protein [Neorhizobium sp. SHOUNA12A]
MKNDRRAEIRESVAATRARQKAAGLLHVSIPLQKELVAEVDWLKDIHNASSRGEVIAEIMRFYFAHGTLNSSRPSLMKAVAGNE